MSNIPEWLQVLFASIGIFAFTFWLLWIIGNDLKYTAERERRERLLNKAKRDSHY